MLTIALGGIALSGFWKTTHHFAPGRALVIGSAISAVIMGGLMIARLRVRINLRAWAESGWTVVTRSTWPWEEGRYAAPANVVIKLGYERTVRGFPVTVLHLTWKADELGTIAPSSNGEGTLIMVRLPDDYGQVGIQRRRNAAAGADKFDRKFRVIALDLSRLPGFPSDELRSAHRDGRVPPWRINGDTLYAFVSSGMAPLHPKTTLTQIDRVLNVLDLLDRQHRSRGYGCLPDTFDSHIP
jgi:hypothetical protein